MSFFYSNIIANNDAYSFGCDGMKREGAEIGVNGWTMSNTPTDYLLRLDLSVPGFGFTEDYYQDKSKEFTNRIQLASPLEYNVFGLSATPMITYKLVKKYTSGQYYSNVWEKQYNFLNYQGSIVGKQTADPYYQSQYCAYYPFGISGYLNNLDSKLTWLGKEKDKFNGYNIFGVRTYDEQTRRFRQIDRLWEKYPAWTPYRYCQNDPVNKLDVDGKEIKLEATEGPENKIDEKTYDAAMYEPAITPTGRAIIFNLDVVFKEIPVTIKFVDEGGIPDIRDDKGNLRFIIYGRSTPEGSRYKNICSGVTILLERNAKMSYTELFGHELWHAIQGVTGFQKYMDTWDLDQLNGYMERDLENEAYRQQNKIHNEIKQNSNYQLEDIK